MIRTILLLTASLLASAVMAKNLSLGEISDQLINQEVVVLGRVVDSKLADWWFMNNSPQGPWVPGNLRGQHGIVVGVEQDESSRFGRYEGENDVFGKKIDNSKNIDPHIKVLVKLMDGETIIETRSSYSSLFGSNLQLATQAASKKKEIDSILNKLVGRRLYRAGYTKLLDPTLSLTDLMDSDKRKRSVDYLTANLTPLKVIDAKMFEAEYAVVLKVELPNGEIRLLFGSLESYFVKWTHKFSQLSKMDISASEKVPSKFTRRELAAIKEGSIFRGMSEEALAWSIGYPNKVNDWGRGGQQYIYQDGQYVYVKDNVVSDWQSIK